jgi:membrane associated rhomboid family serine protease
MQDSDASPFNAVPAVVILLALAIFGTELLFMAARSGLIGQTRGGADWRILAVQRFAFSGEILDWMIATGRAPAEHLRRFVTYPFVHLSFTHMIFVLVFTLALGKLVGEVVGEGAVAAVFFAAAAAGALVYGLALDDPRPLTGGFPAAYGLIGAYTWLLWVGYGRRGENRLRAFRLIGALLLVQFVFGLLFGVGNDWLAEIAGFATGFALIGLLRPGGWARLVQRLRDR